MRTMRNIIVLSIEDNISCPYLLVVVNLLLFLECDFLFKVIDTITTGEDMLMETKSYERGNCRSIHF